MCNFPPPGPLIWLKPGAAQNLLRLEAPLGQLAVWGGSSLIPAPHPVSRGQPSPSLMLPPWAYTLFLCWPGWESPRPAPHFPLLRDFALGSWQRLPPGSATRSTREPGCWPGGSGPDRGWGHGVTAEDRELCLGSQLPATLAACGEGKGARFHLAVTPQPLTAEDK